MGVESYWGLVLLPHSSEKWVGSRTGTRAEFEELRLFSLLQLRVKGSPGCRIGESVEQPKLIRKLIRLIDFINNSKTVKEKSM